MKLKYLSFLLLFPLATIAQTNHLQGLAVDKQAFAQENDLLSIAFDLVLDQVDVQSAQMIYITPLLSSSQGAKEIALEPLLIVGSKRAKVLDRRRSLKGDLGLGLVPQQIVKRTNRSAQRVSYRAIIPYEEWMRKSSLTLLANVTGCASCEEGSGIVPVAENFIKETFIPKLNYISPMVQPSKRKANFSGVINFKVDKADILVDYKNNFVPIKRADDLMHEVKSIEGAYITSVEVKGYASPEASVAHNKDLSNRRANAFADYIARKHDLPRNVMKVKGEGEDWDGLKTQVESSSLQHKSQILDIIATVSNPDERDAPLKKMDGGKVYRTLLNDYYPQLRRIEMNIDYEVKEQFDPEQEMKKYSENPSEMSLNEYNFLSQQYQAGSSEFNELFSTASKYHKDDVIVNLNVAVAEIEQGKYREAIDLLANLENEPRVWNILGIAHARLEDYAKAEEYFSKAAAQGDTQAKENMDSLKEYLGK